MSREPATAPWWASAGPAQRERGDNAYFIGEAHGAASLDEAKKRAFAAALGQASLAAGVKVETAMTDVTIEVNGRASYAIGMKNQVTGVPITLRVFREEGAVIERWQRSGGIEYDARVAVAVPKLELLRIVREARGLCGLGVVASDARHARALLEFAKKLAEKKRLTLTADATLVSAGAAAKELASKSDAAFFLVTQLDADEPTKEGNAFFSRIRLSARLISLTEDKEIFAINEEVKAGDYSPAAMMDVGLKQLTRKILEGP